MNIYQLYFYFYSIFLPNLLISIIIIAIGILASYFVVWVVKYILSRKRVQNLFTRYNIKMALSLESRNLIYNGVFWFVLLLFVRYLISYLGFDQLEYFLGQIIRFIPDLIIGLMILFFGIRFSDTVFKWTYDIFKINDEKLGRIFGYISKYLVIFMTISFTINQIKIIDPFIINSLVIGLVSALSLAFGISFGLGGQERAKTFLETKRKR